VIIWESESYLEDAVEGIVTRPPIADSKEMHAIPDLRALPEKSLSLSMIQVGLPPWLEWKMKKENIP
tara:strand:- start:838 stop:1038 length:201 start_codon:yes stop_codon:yes gene_type:complete